MRFVVLASAAACALFAATGAGATGTVIKDGYEFKKPKAITPDAGQSFGVDPNGVSPTVFDVGSISIGFEGISQYDTAAVARNFIPPDTIGAAGKTQYMQFVNGGVAVYDKLTGARQSFTSDTAFWNNVAGQAGIPNGDSRVLYNAKANRWIALSFGANAKDIQIAVSNTSDALGTWQSTKFEGYAGFGFGATADYPTLALDNNAIYIGTNNFAPATSGGTNSFRGTTLNVIPIASLFNKTTPTTTGIVQFVTPFSSSSPNNDFTRGFAIQGVNSNESTDGIGHVISGSIADNGLTRYDVLNAGTNAAVRTATTSTLIGSDYAANAPARQPSPVTANRRIIDSFDDRISSSAFEVNGRIYSVHTVTALGGSFTQVRVTVLDTATDAVLEEYTIGDGTHDYYQGSLAVNALGQVVVGYNRSGFGADGKITLAAQSFRTALDGSLIKVGDEIVLRVSDTDDYHNGSTAGLAAAGRQRWADYATVTLDPTSSHGFYVSGTFAREPNDAANGHPGGTGGTRWGTYIAGLNVGSVPEPATWAMMIIGFGAVGGAQRRRRVAVAA